MKKKLHLIIIACVLFVACLTYAHINKMHCMFDNGIDPSNYTVINLENNNVYQQPFTCEENIIDGISIKLAVTGDDLQETEFKYEICDENGASLRTGKIQGDEISNNKYNKLKVNTIENVKGDNLSLKIEVESCEANTLVSMYKADDNIVAKYYAFRFDFETFTIACSFCLYIFFFMKLLFKLFKE